MTGQNTNNLSDAIRNLIVCDTQFGWTGETTLKLPELLDLQARGWLIEGDENCEFSLTDEGQAVVARALQQHAPAELAEQQGDALIDTALGYLSTALDDLDSSPDRRPGIMVTEAMQALREAIATRQPGAQEPITVEAVATVRRSGEGDRYIYWLTEGGIADLEAGDVLMVSDRAITNHDGAGEVYAAPPAQGIDLGVTEEEREWIDYAIAHMRDDSEPEDLTCADALEQLLRRIDGPRDAAPGVGS